MYYSDYSDEVACQNQKKKTSPVMRETDTQDLLK